MRGLIATDAWHPQISGVVHTLTSLQRSAQVLGADISFLSPQGFKTVPAPTYPRLQPAVPDGREIARRIEAYGVVQLEALACGVPLAAFPVTGPRDVIGASNVGVLDQDLHRACLTALDIPREACREPALGRSRDKSARRFLRNMGHALIRNSRDATVAFAR